MLSSNKHGLRNKYKEANIAWEVYNEILKKRLEALITILKKAHSAALQGLFISDYDWMPKLA